MIPPELRSNQSPPPPTTLLFKPEDFGLPSDITILSKQDERLLFCEIPMARIIWKDVPVDERLTRVVEAMMDKETQNRRYGGQMAPGFVAQVIDHRIGINGDLYLCNGFHRMTIHERKGDKIFYAQLKLGCSYDEMLTQRIVDATGHRAVELPRIVDWVNQSWTLTEWKNKISVIQAFALITVPNLSGDKMGLTPEEVKQIKDWVLEHCEQWDKKPPLIMTHLDLARKASPEIIRAMRVGQKGEAVTPAQVRAIANALPGEHMFSTQELAATVAVRQRLNEVTTRRMAVALATAKASDEMEKIVNHNWKAEEARVHTSLRSRRDGEKENKREISISLLMERIWDLEVENAQFLVDLAIATKKIATEKLFDKRQRNENDSGSEDGLEIEIPVELATEVDVVVNEVFNLRSSDKDDWTEINNISRVAVAEANKGKPTMLYSLFEEIMRRPLETRLRIKFGVNEDQADDIIQEMWAKAIPELKKFSFRNENIPPYNQIAAYLTRIAINHTIDNFRTYGKHHDPTSLDDLGQIIGDNFDADDMQRIFEDQRIHEAIIQLSESDQRRVVILKFVLGIETEQIASILGKDKGAVRAQLHRAIIGLKNKLKNEVDTSERDPKRSR